MNWKKALGFGVLIWVVMFILISIFIAYNMTVGLLVNAVVTIVTLVVAYFLARNIAPSGSGIALKYGLVFAVVGIVLDYLISQKFAPGMFASVWYWVYYVLLLLVPLLAVKKTMVQAQPSQPQQ